jgi:hypothetical protein
MPGGSLIHGGTAAEAVDPDPDADPDAVADFEAVELELAGLGAAGEEGACDDAAPANAANDKSRTKCFMRWKISL